MFNEQKTAQIAAFFLGKTQEKRMPHLKLTKLLYLADREAVRVLGLSMTGDHLVAMPYGPVLTKTLDLMRGSIESAPGGWDDLISGIENYEVSVRKKLNVHEMDKLSQAEIDVLESVWEQFGQMDQWEISEWTHRNCSEWENPQGSSWPISYYSVARAVGFDDESAIAIAERFDEQQYIDNFFSAL
ncbi:MAG: Panacea domain-containing protein [Magnetococcus sp. DMHC-1]|nr:SocA family protein [Magnetococcales bacterium]